MKGRESGDVRLILDTKGERVAEGEKKCSKKKTAHCRTGRPLSELQNIGAGDTERTEALVITHLNAHTHTHL